MRYLLVSDPGTDWDSAELDGQLRRGSVPGQWERGHLRAKSRAADSGRSSCAAHLHFILASVRKLNFSFLTMLLSPSHCPRLWQPPCGTGGYDAGHWNHLLYASVWKLYICVRTILLPPSHCPRLGQPRCGTGGYDAGHWNHLVLASVWKLHLSLQAILLPPSHCHILWQPRCGGGGHDFGHRAILKGKCATQ